MTVTQNRIGNIIIIFLLAFSSYVILIGRFAKSVKKINGNFSLESSHGEISILISDVNI